MQRCSARINNHEFGVSETVESVPLLHFEIMHTRDEPMFDTFITRCDDLIATLTDMRERAVNAKAYHDLTGELYGEL